ncbi:MAG: M28 family peptidase [Planctomycetes bacterium]|nr:M28 family peptidase [Planctomycetota bacterium]
MRARHLSALCLAFASAPLGAQAPAPSSDVQRMLDLIDPEFLKGHLYYIASDTLGGRDTPSKGLDLAAGYLAAHLKRLGFVPAPGQSSYFQPIEMVGWEDDPAAVLVLECGDRKAELAFDQEWSGRLSALEGELVFAGFGLRATDGSWDDFAGIDVKDKIAVVLRERPQGLSEQLFRRDHEKGGRTVTVRAKNTDRALELGAKAVLELTTLKPNARARRGGVSYQFAFKGGNAAPSPIVEIREDGLAAVQKVLGLDLEAFKQSKAPASRALGARVALRTQAAARTTTTQNVIGVLPGKDPKLAKEYVVFSAHYDHVGQREGASGDAIFNGADDDGTGTVSLLVLAEAFARLDQRRRSIAMIWHCGEEKGLVGAEYLTTQAPWIPLDDIACLFNIDMIGRNDADEAANANHCYLVGARKISSALDDVIRQFNGDSLGEKLRLDGEDPKQYYFRSDHYMYAQKGVPIVFFCTGEHGDYHRQTDHPDRILYGKMQSILRLVARAGHEFLNRDERPAKDLWKPGQR